MDWKNYIRKRKCTQWRWNPQYDKYAEISNLTVYLIPIFIKATLAIKINWVQITRSLKNKTGKSTARSTIWLERMCVSMQQGHDNLTFALSIFKTTFPSSNNNILFRVVSESLDYISKHVKITITHIGIMWKQSNLFAYRVVVYYKNHGMYIQMNTLIPQATIWFYPYINVP